MSDDVAEEARLLAAVAAAPDDDDVRRAYADFLDGRGDPRGELVRVEIELARLRPRLEMLRATVDPEWRVAVGRHRALVLVRVDPNAPIQTIKAVREASARGLRECKDLVDAVLAGQPQVVREQLEVDEAERLAALFAGCAEVRISTHSLGDADVDGRSRKG